MDEWEKAAERSKIKRISWKRILGTSLNNYVASQSEAGHTKTEIITDIKRQTAKHFLTLSTDGWTWDKIEENLKIGVSARIAEVGIYKKVLGED